MGLMRGAAYLESLRDGREVWLRGERVDPTTHPSLAGCARTFAAVYDLHHDPAHRDLLTMPSPTSGEPVSLGYLLPRSYDDLVRKREMMTFLMRRTGGVIGRLPPHAASIVMGLYDVREILAAEHPAFAEHATAYFEYCREHDLSVCLAFVDPQRSRERPLGDAEILRVVEERPDGIVVRGAKGVATQAPYAHEVLCLTLPRPVLQPEQVVYFACPIATPGLRMICREPLAPRYPADHPAAGAFDEQDAWLVFDDVFIPHDRVFYRRRGDTMPLLFSQLLAWAYHYGILRMAIKAEVLLGIAAAVADLLGTTDDPHVQVGLADAVTYVEVIRALLFEAERNVVRSPSGLAAPNPTQVNVGRVYAIEREPHVLHVLRDICGPGILMSPGAEDLASAAIGDDVRRYLVGADERAADRFRLLQLAWDYVADSFAARQLLFDMFNTRELLSNKLRIARDYDTGPMAALARELAGAEVPARV